jgi:hypothetical protein
MESSTVTDVTRKVIELSLYMDDVIASVETEADAVQVYIDLTGLYDKANLCFKKWMSNSKSVLAQIPQDNRAKKLELLGELSELPTVTTLGLIYDPEDDTLSYKSPTDVEYDVTKRIIISTISRIFDPQDILAPVTIVGRIIAQELWALRIAANIDWDTKLRQSKDERIKELKSQCKTRRSTRNTTGRKTTSAPTKRVQDSPTNSRLLSPGTRTQFVGSSIDEFDEGSVLGNWIKKSGQKSGKKLHTL